MRRIFVAHVEDKPGVLNRVASLFRRRAFNIESLTVGHTETPGVSRMTIVVDTDQFGARRMEANLYKLVNVLRVEELHELDAVVTEIALIKVSADASSRTQVLQLVDVFQARIVDVANDSLMVEVTGQGETIRRLVDVLRPIGIVEMVRTGVVAMARGTARPIERARVMRDPETDEDDGTAMSV